VPSLIDELPVLALFATACQGESVFRSVAELRVKESDRLQGIIDGLSTLGCHAWLDGDDLHIAPGTPTRSATFDPHDDHRMALTWAVAGLCFQPTKVPGFDGIVKTSFPDFIDRLGHLA